MGLHGDEGLGVGGLICLDYGGICICTCTWGHRDRVTLNLTMYFIYKTYYMKMMLQETGVVLA